LFKQLIVNDTTSPAAAAVCVTLFSTYVTHEWFNVLLLVNQEVITEGEQDDVIPTIKGSKTDSDTL